MFHTRKNIGECLDVAKSSFESMFKELYLVKPLSSVIKVFSHAFKNSYNNACNELEPVFNKRPNDLSDKLGDFFRVSQNLFKGFDFQKMCIEKRDIQQLAMALAIFFALIEFMSRDLNFDFSMGKKRELKKLLEDLSGSLFRFRLVKKHFVLRIRKLVSERDLKRAYPTNFEILKVLLDRVNVFWKHRDKSRVEGVEVLHFS